MHPSIAAIFREWPDNHAVELTASAGETLLARFEFGIFNRRARRQDYWTVCTRGGEAEFYIRETADVKVHFFSDRRPHIVVTL